MRADYFRTRGRQILFRVTVTDTGIGIPEAAQNALFTKFTQGDSSTTRKYGGTGLGLAISKELAERMDGSVGLSSQPGKGSSFWVEIPLDMVSEVVVAPVVLASVETPTIPGARVLVAEDNAVNRQLVTRSLQKLGYEVDVAANGSEAVAKWAQQHYDLVLMDCQMPEMDGYQATAQIRSAEAGERHTPIVAVTAHAMSGEDKKCAEAGMDGYLTKPLRMEDLRKTVERYSRVRQDSGGAPVRS